MLMLANYISLFDANIMAEDRGKELDNLPIAGLSVTSSFFKKIEIYQEIVALNKAFRINLRQLTDGSKNTWEIEKKVLFWTRLGHKHLGSALHAEEFTNESKRLKELHLTESEVEDKSGGGQYWLRNLAQRGFAYAEKDRSGSDGRGIIISQKGLLVGRVLNDIYKVKPITDQRYKNKSFWNMYAEKYGATYFLAKSYKYWFYRVVIVSGWLTFVATAILIIWTIIDRIF
jgi:hypothetical protein